MKLVYIAGPYRGPTAWDIERNIHRAKTWGVVVAKCGGFPMIPHSNTAHFDGVAPDQFWLDGTLEMMRRCDAALFIPRWSRSSGARAEHAEANRLGLPILDAEEWGDRVEAGIHADVVAKWLARMPAKVEG